ncbi:hypothetical protein RCH23_002395, partial [Cryobacterium sp. CAN_C3]|nr:hypothetical protein [Cryobacterium sp. CAN_C3]
SSLRLPSANGSNAAEDILPSRVGSSAARKTDAQRITVEGVGSFAVSARRLKTTVP